MSAQEPALDDAVVTTFYSQLLHLLEFTRDMDRNTTDSSFAKAGNQIHYVFDENVFEFFIGSHNQRDKGGAILYEDKRKYSAAFHLAQWRDNPANNSTERRWTRINRQTAIIAGEYVMRGKLPGQFKQRIYLTEWHATELKHRVAVLLEHFRTKASRSEKALSESIQLGIEDIISIVSAKGIRAEELIKKASIPALDMEAISRDVGKLKSAGVDNNELVNFAAARIFAANLIDDDVIEPLQQIRRIYSREIAGRFFPIQLLSPRPEAADCDALREEALRWQERLRTEEEKREADPVKRRNSQSVAADAESLAYLQWIADRLANGDRSGGPRERVVFVTGDTLMFDAYRRWWVDNSEHVFALRRVTQYAPILNFRDAESSIAFNHEIFENTRRAIEPRLMYFNLAERAGDPAVNRADGERGDLGGAAQPTMTRLYGGREHFALLLKGKNPLDSEPFKLFTQRVQGKFIGDRDSNFYSIRDEWQELERLAIGVHHRLIEGRLDEERRAELRECLAEPRGLGIDAFVNKRLVELYHYGAMRYVIGAFDALRGFVRRMPTGTTSRAPIALRLRISPSRGQDVAGPASNPVDVSLMATNLINDSDADTTIKLLEETWLGNPERLFALVSTMALRLSLWDQAVMYAQLAVGSEAAEAIRAEPNRDDQADFFELLYLRALANRFAVGATPISINSSGSRTRQLLDLSLDDLKACIDYHSDKDDGGSDRHILRELRARSERAALEGFYASWLLLRSMQQGEPSEVNIGATVKHLNCAYEDLRVAAAMLDAAEQRARILDTEKGGSEYFSFFSLVAKQVNMNTASLYVFREFLRSSEWKYKGEFDVDTDIFAKASKVLRRKVDNNELADEVAEMMVDIYLFLWLFDQDGRARNVLRLSFSAPREGMLRMDADLLELYQRTFGEAVVRSV